MKKTTVESSVDSYGMVVAETESGSRFRLVKHDVDFDNGEMTIEGEDEMYILPVSQISHLEIPRSRPIE